MSNIYEDIKEWVNFITTPINGYQVCPFAKKANYFVYPNEDYLSIQLKASFFDNNYDLFICRPTDRFMSVERAKQIEADCNRIAKNTITLLDHPDDPGFINDICTSNKKHILFLIQPKKDLLEARKQLQKTSYYDRWSEEYYKKICHINFY